MELRPLLTPTSSSPLLRRLSLDLKFFRLFSYDMKMCIWFLFYFISVSAIFNGVMALADSDLVPVTLATSLIKLILN